jgi:RecB family exonuclease
MVHALAQRVAAGELVPGPDGVDQLMGHVEQVWDRLEFRTPWAKARELERIRSALARFLAWHHANSRTLVGIEAPFRAVLELPNGERVALGGYADRLELDADGRVVVVDLKTGRTKPSDKSVLTNVQLGLYQLAVDHGAADELVGQDAEHDTRAGGAELVQLGLTGDDEHATVQTQPDQADDGPERVALRARLARAAELLRSESFPAIAGQHCRDCDFVPICPIKSAGHVIGPVVAS